jgi:hypothetical protein
VILSGCTATALLPVSFSRTPKTARQLSPGASQPRQHALASLLAAGFSISPDGYIVTNALPKATWSSR